MPVIESQLGSKKFNVGKQYVVDDIEDDSNFEAQVKEYREQKLHPEKQRMTSDSKDRINFLLGLTRQKKEVVVNKTTFVLRTLTSKENRNAIAACGKFQGTPEFQFELRRQFLAYSLEEIEGMGFNDFIKANSFEDRLNFIDSLDESLCGLLYNGYGDLLTEVNSKYSVKTEEEAKEVIEDLKK